jgi:hypothetical protein
MTFKIVYRKGEAELGSAPWPDEEGAIRLARNQFPMRRKRNGATSVIVLDMSADTPKIIFSLTDEEVPQ